MIPLKVPASVPAVIPATLPDDSASPLLEFVIGELIIDTYPNQAAVTLVLVEGVSGCAGSFVFGVLDLASGGLWTEANPSAYARTDVGLLPLVTYNYVATLTKEGYVDWVASGTFVTPAV